MGTSVPQAPSKFKYIHVHLILVKKYFYNFEGALAPPPPVYGLSSLEGLSKLTGAEVKVPFYLCPTNTVGRRP